GSNGRACAPREVVGHRPSQRTRLRISGLKVPTFSSSSRAGSVRRMVAAQLYTLRSLLDDPAMVSDVLGRLRDIGYQAVEVAGLGPKIVDRFDVELRRSGLHACAAHVGLERLTNEFDDVVDECRRWGC